MAGYLLLIHVLSNPRIELLQVSIDAGFAGWMRNKNRIAVSCTTNDNPGNVPPVNALYRKPFALLGFDVDTCVKMLRPKLGKGTGQLSGLSG